MEHTNLSVAVAKTFANLRGPSIALSNVNRKLKTTFQSSIRARLSKAIFDSARTAADEEWAVGIGQRGQAKVVARSSYPYSPQLIKLNTFVCLWPIRNHAQAHLNIYSMHVYMHKQQLLSHICSPLSRPSFNTLPPERDAPFMGQ